MSPSERSARPISGPERPGDSGMQVQFVTGANGAFFPTLMVLLQSFVEQVGGGMPYVCDYGLAPGQREFLRRRGILLERPPAFGPPMNPLREKAILREYFRHSGIEIRDAGAVVWLDGDLTLVGCSRADFEAVAAEMAVRNAEIAAAPQSTIGAMLDVLRRQGPRAAEPFERLVAKSPIDTAKPYYSTGIFLCRSASFLARWAEMSSGVPDQPVLDQNIFNAVVHSGTRSVLPLDIDIWQAQGDTLDSLRIVPDAHGPSSVRLDGKPIKILHATSPAIRHLLIGPASFVAGDLVLEGAFKLLRPRSLLESQLALLSRFLYEHRTELLEVGLCRLAETPVAGYSLRIAGQGPG